MLIEDENADGGCFSSGFYSSASSYLLMKCANGQNMFLQSLCPTEEATQ